MTTHSPRDDAGGRREPAINAPWTVAALIVILVLAHGLRVALGGGLDLFALTSSDFASGRLWGLLTYQGVHGSWAHVLMNSAFVLAFGAPVARFFGGGARGALVFFCFFLLCGAVAASAYAALADVFAAARGGAAAWALVGASGSASGLMGAAALLIEGRGRLGSIAGRTVIGMTVSWILVNAVLGLSGLTPGADGAAVAWQAHIFGFFAGLILVRPAAVLAGVSTDHEIAL